MNILLIDAFPPDMVDALIAQGHTVRYEPEWGMDELRDSLADVDILVMNSKVNANAELLAIGPKLKLICRAGVGMDHFDLPLLEARGIQALNTPGANAIAVAEQAIGMLLCLMHNVARADRQVHQYQWLREENRGTEIYGKTVGVIGHGHTGSAVTQRLSGFGGRVIAYDKYKTGFGNAQVQEGSLEEIVEAADILTLHIPLTEETRGWVNADFFARFRKPIWLLNLSRGPIVPLAGLITAFHRGHVIAAGLDVLENEKLTTLTEEERARLDQLLAIDRVLITPHIGGWSHESLRRINQQLVDGIAKFTLTSPSS